ncbi:uncharacterized protein K02A2.6-like, partial [Argonauta hians]
MFELEGKDYLITVDYLSNYWEIDRLKDTRAITVIKAMKAHFARYGSPCTVMSDNGPQFTSENFRRFAVDFDFNHVTSSPYHSRSNGKAESAVKTAKSILRKNKDGDQFLALLNYRNTPSQNSDTSPAQKFFNRRTRTLLPMCNKLLRPEITLRSDIENIQKGQSRMKTYHDKGAKDLKPLCEGEAIVMRPHTLGNKIWRRGVVLNGEGRSCNIETSDGSVVRRNRVHLRKVPDRAPIPTLEHPEILEPLLPARNPEIPTATEAVTGQSSPVKNPEAVRIPAASPRLSPSRSPL